MQPTTDQPVPAQTSLAEGPRAASAPAASAKTPRAASAPARGERPGVARPPQHVDRRSQRTRRALRDALAAEIRSAGDLSRVGVTGLAARADVTRRTFYSHYRDIADLVERSEDELLAGLAEHLRAIAGVDLESLADGLTRLEPCPGSVELLEFVRGNGELLAALLGPGGDAAFAEKIKRMATETVCSRAMDGIDAAALGPFFDYYLAFAVSAEVGVLQRWLEGGMRESVRVMARVMTVLMFVRPGDLYGRPIDVSLPAFGRLLMHMNLKESA